MSVNNQYLNAQNVLISKDDVGKSKPAPYKLPDSSFAYGKQEAKDGYGAKEGTSKIQNDSTLILFQFSKAGFIMPRQSKQSQAAIFASLTS